MKRWSGCGLMVMCRGALKDQETNGGPWSGTKQPKKIIFGGAPSQTSSSNSMSFQTSYKHEKPSMKIANGTPGSTQFWLLVGYGRGVGQAQEHVTRDRLCVDRQLVVTYGHT